MADVVQYRLERMVPQLNDLEKQSLFTRQELAEIVKARRKFEYRLKRPSPLKEDFLEYIEYEKQLDRLRHLRKKAVSGNEESGGGGGKNKRRKKSDFAGERRVIELYRMAVSRFKGDLQLWWSYLEFCKEKKNGRMKKVLAEVVKFHPKVPAVWIYAASWESAQNLNHKAARALMQTGLRACPNSEELWVEFLRLEMTFFNKLITRRGIIEKDNATLVHDDKSDEDKHWQDENEGLFMSLNEEKGSDDGLVVQEGDSINTLDGLRETAFMILQEIYKEAAKALPSSFSLRKKFLEVLEAINVAHSEKMRTEILSDIRRDFSREPEYWDWLARLKLPDPDITLDISLEGVRLQVDEGIKVYEEAIQILPSIVMFEMFIKFLMNVIDPKIEEKKNSAIFVISEHAADYISQLVRVFGKAEAMGCLSEDLVCQYLKFFLHMGKVDEALKLAENLCEGKFSDAKQLWILRLTEQMRILTESGNFSKAHLSSVFDLLNKMVKKVSTSDAEGLWVMALELFAKDKKYFDKLLNLSLVSLARDGGSDDGFSLPATLVNFVWQKGGIQQARDFYRRLITLPHPGLAIYKRCIELEISTRDEASLANARKLFECALATYSREVSLWQEYYSMETEMGTSETANGIYWRAKKTIGDVSALAASPIQ